MYKIIGANQVEYGPITADQMRAWIAEGRVNAQTPVQGPGDTTWKPLSMFAEFASALPATPPPTSPPPFGMGPGDADGRARALSLVSGPAIALMVTAILGILITLLRLCLNLLGVGMSSMPGFADSNQNPELERMVVMMSGVVGVVVFIVATILWVIVLYGAMKMKKLEKYGLGIAASIIAMIPCLCPCCIFGLPFGIWALVILNKPDVKQHFTS